MNYVINPKGGVIRDDGVNIPEAPGNRDWNEYLEWLADGNTATPVPTPSLMEVIVDRENAVQLWLDSIAQANGYNDMAQCVSYMNSTVDIWKADAIAGNALRDAVWTECFAQAQTAIAAPPASYPSAEEIIAALPQPSQFGWVVHLPGATS